MDINSLDTITRANVESWLNGEYDQESKRAIRDMMENNPQELKESFYKSLEFGTGGLRGIMGVGTNRMNTYNVAMATQGLANYVKRTFGEQRLRAAVSHDSRNHSREFAMITANVLAANGFHVYLFESLRPTPELSFAVRHFRCQTGVMITASHNPKEYNGYKAYWNDGCQLTPPHDVAVMEEVAKIKGLEEVRLTGGEKDIEIVGETVDAAFLEKVKENAIHPELIKKHSDLKIVYTPLHGAGTMLVPRALREIGFANVNVVKEQAEPNGDFPTTPSPNPEEHAAMEMCVSLAKKMDADIAFASDPDADRVGVAVKRPDGQWMLLNGNQTLSTIVYYLVHQRKEAGLLKGDECVVSTIVTSMLPGAIARGAGVDYYEVLTGFKWIGNKILELEGERQFIVGGEESYGYMIGDFVRDKDAVSSCCMIAEIAAWAKERGMTYFDLLAEIYMQYGFYKEGLLSVVRKGMAGAQEIEDMMKAYRAAPPKELGGSKVTLVKDFKEGKSHDVLLGKEEALTLPKSNVLQFYSEDGTRVTVRPSGTEPKIKFYFSVKGELKSVADFDKTNDTLDTKIAAIQKALQLV
ncbi:MAG: phospho-sugar mutase [Bacteroidales bacterium]|nr:phospho-sugar mutase [Bacteroidales bacterium]